MGGIPRTERSVPEPLRQQIDRLQELHLSQMDPTGRAFVPLADTHRRLGELDRALEVLREGLAVHPDFASAHVVTGWLYRDRREDARAIRSFERVLELDAENRVALRSLAELVRDAGQRAEYLERLLELDPDDLEMAAVRDHPEAEVAARSARRGTPQGSDPSRPSVTEEERAAELESAEIGESVASEMPTHLVSIVELAPDAREQPDDRVQIDVVIAEPEAGGEPVPIGQLAPHLGDARRGTHVPAQTRSVPTAPSTPVAAEKLAIDDAPGEEPGTTAGHTICTVTLGELYAEQGAVARAVDIFRRLLVDDPDNAVYLRRVAELTRGMGHGPPSAGSLPVASWKSAPDRSVVPIECLAPNPVPGTGEPGDAVSPGPPPALYADPRQPRGLVTEYGGAAQDDPPVVAPIESLAPDGSTQEDVDAPFRWRNTL